MKIGEITEITDVTIVQPSLSETRRLLSTSAAPWAIALRQKWGSAERLMSVFNPSLQSECARHLDSVFSREKAPSVARFAGAFGTEAAKAWLVLQLRQLGEFAGQKDKQSLKQMDETAEVLMAEYGYLTLTEIMLYFHKFKCGAYGTFYGSVDGIAICAGMKDFLEFRRDHMNRLEREKRERERAAQEAKDKAECISFSEYLRRKEAMNAQK